MQTALLANVNALYQTYLDGCAECWWPFKGAGEFIRHRDGGCGPEILRCSNP